MEEQPLRKLRYDVASVLNPGRRAQQEDALAADFPHGGELSFAVLSDGMGGHAAGEIASKIVVTEVFSELKFQSSDPAAMEENMGEILRAAAVAANECVQAHTQSDPGTAGMGATLLAPIITKRGLWWISVGDSPLYLFRDGSLTQLNEDHSLAPQIDQMAQEGLIEADVAQNHPDRNCLTSVLIGETIEKIDCPEAPTELLPGDIVIAASDGLQVVPDAQIEKIIKRNRDLPGAQLAEELLHKLLETDDPNQDNLSFCLIKVREANRRLRTKPVSLADGPVLTFGGDVAEAEGLSSSVANTPEPNIPLRDAREI